MDWQSIEAALDRAVSSAFAELVRLTPLKNGVADPDRPVAEILAVLHHPSVDGQVSFGAGMMTSVSASKHCLVIERSRYPATGMRAKDVIRAISRPGTPAYEVAKVSDRHSGVVIVELNER